MGYLFFLLISIYSLRAEDPLNRVKVTADCDCEIGYMDETPSAIKLKKDSLTGLSCRNNDGGKIYCHLKDQNHLICPKSCVTLVPQVKLVKKDWETGVAKYIQETAGPAYAKVVPQKILNALNKKASQWLPVMYSREVPYELNFRQPNFYFEIPLHDTGKDRWVGVLYYFVDLDHLMRSEMIWSFWDVDTAELIYDARAPYKTIEGHYVNSPCPSPAGKNLDKVVLYGFAGGTSDASGCCGPYSLENLRTKGPESLPKKSDYYDSDIIYSTCSLSLDDKRRFRPPLQEIDGPANIREKEKISWKGGELIWSNPPEKSKVIGSCADKTKVISLGTNGDWHLVKCNGHEGWTHKKNIRTYFH